MHKKNIGNIGELLVITQCLKNNCNVFKDVGDNSKVDLIVMNNKNVLFKIQVKHFGREKNDSVTFVPFYKSGPNYRFVYRLEEVDYFAVVDQQSERIAWIKYSDFSHMKSLSLRHNDPKNCQKESIRYFHEFEYFPFNS